MSSEIRTISISPIWSKIAREKDISLSKAVKDGIALNLALLDESFPFTDIEDALYNDCKLPAYKAQLITKIVAIYSTKITKE